MRRSISTAPSGLPVSTLRLRYTIRSPRPVVWEQSVDAGQMSFKGGSPSGFIFYVLTYFDIDPRVGDHVKIVFLADAEATAVFMKSTTGMAPMRPP